MAAPIANINHARNNITTQAIHNTEHHKSTTGNTTNSSTDNTTTLKTHILIQPDATSQQQFYSDFRHADKWPASNSAEHPPV
jgi:hypothetical protein